jgi:hypothetical protein
VRALLKAITEKFTDHSTTDSFAFSFHCDCCGRAWRSAALAFSHEGFALPMDEKVRAMLWTEQHKNAYERANCEAISHFNHCPECGRWVCDDCFFVSEAEHTDICRQCNSQG